MKNYKIVIYIVSIIVVVSLGFVIFKNVSQANEEDPKEKVDSEVRYLETTLVGLLNDMNNIDSRNYNLSVDKIPQESQKTSQGSGSSSSASGGGSGGSSGSGSGAESGQESAGGDNSSEGGSSGDVATTGSDSSQTDKSFELNANGVLTNTEDINWDVVKNKVENMYISTPTITIDLYSQNISQDDILGFNKECDALTVATKSENKVETLASLSRLYDYIPKFLVNNDELNKNLIQAKAHIIKAYSKLDSGNWNEIATEVKSAVDIFSNLLTNTNIDASKQYSINKTYIMLNELQNAVNIQDSTVFLIKYKNLLEEFENMWYNKNYLSKLNSRW